MTLDRKGTSNPVYSTTPLSRAVILWAAIGWASACAQATIPSYPNGMSQQEFEFAGSVIAQDTTWRLASAEDSKNQKSILELRRADSTYQPFFCRSSVDQSVSSYSFVLARADTFRVIYVRRGRGSEAILDEVARMTWLDDGQITCREDGIEIAPFNSDEVLTFRWNVEQGKLELLKEEPAERDDPS